MPAVFVHEQIDPTGASLAWLEERGVRVRLGSAMWRVPPESLSEEQIVAGARGCVALMGGGGNQLTRRVIESLPDLRFISKYGIGMNSIDLDAARERGIAIAYTPIPADTEATAEHAIAVILALKKRLYDWTPEFMRGGGWRGESVWAEFLKGQTIGLVGYGRVGKAVARRLQGWGVRLLAFDRTGRYDAYVEGTGLDQLLRESDVVSLHLTLTNETRHVISRAALDQMPPHALLVNTARGELVDVDELIRALKEGRLGGAAIDVYETEPPPRDHPLFRCPRLVATPHAAAWTRFTMAEMGRVGAENLWEMLCGRPAIYPVEIS